MPRNLLADAVAAHRRGELDKAEADYRAILRTQPNHFDAIHMLGAVLSARAKNKEAETLLRRALALKPSAAAAHNNLGNVVNAQGRPEEALACYGRAIALDAKYADALNNRGNVFGDLGRGTEALADYDRVLELNPDYVNALHRSAKLLADLGRGKDALVRLDRATSLGAGSADAWMRSGNVLMQLKKPREALESYDKAMALRPNSMVCMVNRCVALAEVGRSRDALEGLDFVLARHPNDTGSLNNKATILKSLGRVGEALEVYRKSLAIKPDDAETQSNFALTLLLIGDFDAGWRAFEHRWAKKEVAPTRPALPFAEWSGEDLRGRAILICAEQGLGDIVQFSRYLPLLKERGAKVGFLVAGKMHAVLRAAYPGITLFGDVAQVQPLPFDFRCALMSLPLHFKTRPDNIPAAIPYLTADAERISLWRERIGPRGFKVGIAWQGNPNVSVDHGRSIPLEAFAPLASVPGVRLISLQKNDGVEQIEPSGVTLEMLGPDFDSGRDSFVGTLAAMECLDLVVTSDTSIAHVAGALARPVWVALKHVPDWRWMLDRDDCPWYPTMRLFRQNAPNDWADVMARIRSALATTACGQASP